MKTKIIGLMNRTYDLIIKMISVKGFIFLTATWLMLLDKMTPYIWGFFAAAFVGIRTLEKFLLTKKDEVK